MSLSLILVVTAFVCTILSAMGKCPLWVAVLLLCVLEMIKLFG